MGNLKVKLLKLLESSQEDKEVITSYIENSDIDDLFENYNELDISDNTKDQIQSLIIILENYKDV